MAITREFSKEEIGDLLDDAIEIDSQPWRHGRRVRLVFEHEGAHWAAWFHMHHEVGDQSTYPITATKVHQVERTVKVWETAP
jgi:hypothetical protein